jgi:ubiquinone/menaquinone biosynthesis C-methylase UbiE
MTHAWIESNLESKVRQEYDRLAAIYDQRWNRYVTDTLTFLKHWLDLSPREMVLDIACGTGELERLLLEENPTQTIVGVDISGQMLGIAQHKLTAFPSVSFQIASASQLPFSSHCFDVVISANSFHYFEDPAIAIVEMKRVLKFDGKIVILDWCKDFLLCRICDFLLQWLDPAHRQCYTQAEFHHLLTTAGLELQCAQKVRFGWFWGLMIVTAQKRSFYS